MSIAQKPENLKKLVAERIDNGQLRLNLYRATEMSLSKRQTAVADYPEWESMRQAAHDIKKDVIDHVADYLELFDRNATEHGAKVMYAQDGYEACNIIVEITRMFGGKLVVKSKSMTTEEIGLDSALEQAGITAIETDLGEYIVQLAGEPPSHITAPALHKSREEIGHLFEEKLGIPYTSDPEKLTGIARRILRGQFLTSQVGVSGVNFAIAETGAIYIVENEGNARLSTSLPRVHIAVMGFEKLLPDHESAMLFLNMLARSATGQRMSCYTSVINGPRSTDEPDGPDALYIIVLDNGRLKILEDKHFREALYCIRCGACMNVCPVFQKIGGHGYGSIYAGPIGSVITPIFKGLKRGRQMPFASSLCGACSEICPVKIDLHRMLLQHRMDIVDTSENSFFERIVMKLFLFMMKHHLVYRIWSKKAALISPLFHDDRCTLRVPIWSKTRDFPRVPAKSFKDLWKEHQHGLS